MAGTSFNLVGVAKFSVNGIITAPSPTLQNNFLRDKNLVGQSLFYFNLFYICQ